MKTSDPKLDADGCINFVIEITPNESEVLTGIRRAAKIQVTIDVPGLPIKAALLNKTKRAVEASGAVDLKVVSW